MESGNSVRPFSDGPGLKSVDRIEITCLVDNYTNVLLPTVEAKSDMVTRSPFWVKGRVPNTVYPLAEHGLSLLIRLWEGGEERAVILDAGVTGVGIAFNIKVLEVDLSKVRTVVLSHGHNDHFGGLAALLGALGPGVTVIAHGDAFLTRFRKYPDGDIMEIRPLEEEGLRKLGAKVEKAATALLLASGGIATTGVVARTTDFEALEPGDRFIGRGGKMDRDMVLDDLSLVLNLAGRGLVVVTGCAHAGTINIIRHAQKMTGVTSVYAVLGGMHLIGRGFEEKTLKTIQELKKIAPSVIVPMHCNHHVATDLIAGEMPDAFILNSVGTSYRFVSAKA